MKGPVPGGQGVADPGVATVASADTDVAPIAVVDPGGARIVVAAAGFVTDSGIVLRPDSSRVVSRFFVAGREDVGPGPSRAAAVIQRVLELDESAVETSVEDLTWRFSDRHRDLQAVFNAHAERLMSRLGPEVELSPARRSLLGASFTHEYSIESASLCNPSAVLHPTQPTNGDTTFVMSVRGIGEGHRSSIGFRTGTLSADGTVRIDAPGPYPETVGVTPSDHSRSVFHMRLEELDDDGENAAFVLDALPARFDDAALHAHIDELARDTDTRRRTHTTITNLRKLAEASYRMSFPEGTELSERVLWPHASIERNGMEDARFVRFVGATGRVRYYATYTAFDGADIAQQLLETTDFRTFTASPMTGRAAVGKGLALFPRKIGGRYAALSRSDRETNAITFSDDICCWSESAPLQAPEEPWEVLQLGNCGSPIETDAGWLVVTHGVGPMRTYSLGAILLDLEQPQRVLARTLHPFLVPSAARRDGYVPNVVYSCGGFAVGDVLVLPYGLADQAIAVATISIRALINSMERVA